MPTERSTAHPLTVCFYIQDREQFKALSDRFFDSMMNDTEVEGAVITAISTEDEFARVERLENEVQGTPL